MDKKNREFKPITVVIMGFVVVAVVLIGISIYKYLQPNPYADQTRIENFSEYFPEAPKELQDRAFSVLYNMIEMNIGDDEKVPKGGALIRSGSFVDESSDDIREAGIMVVDIEEIKQSYSLSVRWFNSEVQTQEGPTRYYASIECLEPDKIIYSSFNCKSLSANDSLEEKFPIISSLPIMVEYYSDDYSLYTKYFISYALLDGDTKVELKITDYTGGNYENALLKVKELGYEPSDYEIEYNDVSNEYTSVYVGDD